MSRKKSTPPAASVPISVNPWSTAFGLLACALVVLVPFFPDEKLVRLKLQVLEGGLFVLMGLIGVRAFLSGDVPFKNIPRVFFAMLAWLVVNIGLWLLSTEKSLASPELRRIILGAAAFFALALAGLNADWRKRFLWGWSFSAGLLALYGILQRTGGVGVLMVPQMERVMGTYGNPIFFAAFLVPSLFVTLEAFSRAGSSLQKALLGAAGGLQVVALFFTQTRASMVALAATGILALSFKSKLKQVPAWVLLLAVAAAGLLAVQTRQVWDRDQGHLLIWRDTVRMWSDHPVTGVGLGAFHTNFPNYAQDDLKQKWPQGQFIVNYTHNEYLQSLAEGGVLVPLSFLAILALFFLSTPFSYLSLGVAAIAVQNFFSVDMRFGLSLASCLMLVGFSISENASPDGVWQEGPLKGRPVRFLFLGGWLALLAFLIAPLLQPYKAEKEVSAAVGFFDERLLDPAKTIQDLEALAAQYPEEPPVLEKLAYVYAKEIRTPDQKVNVRMAEQAIGVYQRLIQLQPGHYAALNNLANIHYTIGHTDAALETWERAVKAKPDFLDPHLNLGKILYVKGRLKESAAHFQEVLKIDPNNAEAIVYLKRMVE